MSSGSKDSTARVPRPRWGLLYGVVFVGLAALALVDVNAAAAARTVLDGVMGAAVFLGIAFWTRTNRVALDRQNWCACAADTLTVRVIPSRRPGLSRSSAWRPPTPARRASGRPR